jgi:hypothetical protein
MTCQDASLPVETLLSALGGLATRQPRHAAALYIVIEQFSDGPGISEQPFRLADCRNVVLALASNAEFANPIAVWRIVLGEPAEDVTASFALMAGFLRMARHTVCDLPEWILDAIPSMVHPHEVQHEPGHA